MGSAGAGGDLFVFRRDATGAAVDETEWDIFLCATAGPGADGVLEAAVSPAVLERSGGEFAEEWVGSLSGGVADSAGVGVQCRGGEPCECVGADATAAFGGEVDGAEGGVEGIQYEFAA